MYFFVHHFSLSADRLLLCIFISFHLFSSLYLFRCFSLLFTNLLDWTVAAVLWPADWGGGHIDNKCAFHSTVIFVIRCNLRQYCYTFARARTRVPYACECVYLMESRTATVASLSLICLGKMNSLRGQQPKHFVFHRYPFPCETNVSAYRTSISPLCMYIQHIHVYWSHVIGKMWTLIERRRKWEKEKLSHFSWKFTVTWLGFLTKYDL